MSLQNIVDRVPTLPGRYLITHEDNSTEYVTVQRADEPSVDGTSFNRALFRNLQGDIYTGIQYSTPTYSGTAMTLDLPLTSYETGKIINIKSPATFSSNPTLNVNGLGAKTVNALLTANQKCTLVYNGSSFDVITDVATNKYYPITKTTSTTNITGVNILSQNNWTLTGTNEYTSENGIKIWATTTSSSYIPTNAVDGSTSSAWRATSNSNQYFYIEFPQPIKINKMKTYITATGSGSSFGFAVSGSNDLNTWSGNALANSYTRQTALTELTFNSSYTAAYKYYRVYVYTGTSNNYPQIYELEVSDYDAYLFTGDYPVTSVDDNFQINVKPNADTLAIGKNYLLLSGLGTAKEIEGSMTQNELATLIYNGTKFIKVDYVTEANFTENFNANVSFKQGTVSDGSTIPQTEGFTNYLYFVSPYEAISVVAQTSTYPYGDTSVECRVDQSTRSVVCKAGVYKATGSSSGWTKTSGTANYLEIAWN